MSRRAAPAYVAYCKKYDFVLKGIRAKNTYMTDKYTEDEFNDIYTKIRETRLDWKDYPRDRIIQYIVFRQKRYFDLY